MAVFLSTGSFIGLLPLPLARIILKIITEKIKNPLPENGRSVRGYTAYLSGKLCRV